MKQIIIFFSVLIFGTAQIAFAEETDTYTLDTVVVSATRTEKKIDDAPANVTVITKEDIQKYGIETIDDAIRYDAGVFVQRDGGLSDMMTSVTMRGLSGQNRTLILLNGVPVNDGYSGSVYWNTIGIENVERIELTRGGGSALYGGNAMGGVINIITTKPEKLETGISGGYGSNKTYKYSAFVGNRYERFRIRVGYEAEKTDGYPMELVSGSISSGEGTLTGGYEITNASGRNVWVFGDKGEKETERSNLNLMLSYDMSDTGTLSFDFQRGMTDWDYDRPTNTYLRDEFGNPAFSGSVNAGEGKKASAYTTSFLGYPGDVENYAGSLSYNESFGTFGFTGKVGYKYYETRYIYPLSGTYDDASGMGTWYDAESWVADIQTDIPLGDRHLLTGGIYFRTDTFNSESYNLSYYRDEDSKLDKRDSTEGKARFYALYLQDEWNILRQLTLYGGVRFDFWKGYDGKSGNAGSEVEFDDADDSAISPQIAGVWHPLADTYIRGSVSKAFRAPTIYALPVSESEMDRRDEKRELCGRKGDEKICRTYVGMAGNGSLFHRRCKMGADLRGLCRR